MRVNWINVDEKAKPAVAARRAKTNPSTPQHNGYRIVRITTRTGFPTRLPRWRRDCRFFPLSMSPVLWAGHLFALSDSTNTHEPSLPTLTSQGECHGQRRTTRESRVEETKKRKDQNNCCSAEPKGHSGRLATDGRIKQKRV